MSPGVGYVGAAVVIATAVTYKCVGDRTLNFAKEKLLAQQRSAIALVGPDWFPVRDAAENETLQAAKGYAGDFVDPGLARWDFRAKPGIYLRLRVADARDSASVRAVAGDSSHDGFTACLLRVTNDPLLDNVPDASAFPEQPWTLGQAYEGTHVLDDSWTAEVRDAPNTLSLDVLQEEYDKARREGIPLAGRIARQARYLLLVLDEDVPEAIAVADGGAVTEAALQLVPHPSRIYVVDLESKKEMLRLRRTGTASFRGPGDFDAAKRDSMQRQVNNCALAKQVESALPSSGGAAASDGK